MTLSVVMVTYNSADVVEEALKSVVGLWDELLVGDGGSTDGTLAILKKYQKWKTGFRIESGMTKKNLGERKQELVERAKGAWILVLDADERVSPELAQEIRRITAHHKIRLEHKNVMNRLDSMYFTLDPRLRGDDREESGDDKSIVAYSILYQNYVFGRPVYYGGERYAKVRLFRRGTARISPEPLHEEVILSQELPKARPSQRLRPGLEGGNVRELRGVIHHHSYRTPWQLLTKFTRYAWMEAGMIIERKKSEKGDGGRLDPDVRRDDRKERGGDREGVKDTMWKKLFLYGPHMFWARYIKEKGYKDGWRGLVLALAFGYMEGLTYWFFIRRIFTRPGLPKS